jgi:hypothetical protein
MDAGHAGIKGDADNVEIVAGIRDKLFLRHPADGLNLVANARRLFKLQTSGSLSPSGDELGQDLIVFAGKEQRTYSTC